MRFLWRPIFIFNLFNLDLFISGHLIERFSDQPDKAVLTKSRTRKIKNRLKAAFYCLNKLATKQPAYNSDHNETKSNGRR